jgi:hypothetical protein
MPVFLGSDWREKRKAPMGSPAAMAAALSNTFDNDSDSMCLLVEAGVIRDGCLGVRMPPRQNAI